MKSIFEFRFVSIILSREKIPFFVEGKNFEKINKTFEEKYL